MRFHHLSHRFLSFVILLSALCGAQLLVRRAEAAIQCAPASERFPHAASAGVAVPFVAGEGQSNAAVAFFAKTSGGAVFVTKKGEIVCSLFETQRAQDRGHDTLSDHLLNPRGWSLVVRPVDGISTPTPGKPAESNVSVFHGDRPEFGGCLPIGFDLVGESPGNCRWSTSH